MSQALELLLGILAAAGGFVEIGQFTFAVHAGSAFGFHLLWVVALGTTGIVVYGEMAGRIAAVRRQPVFQLIRERAGLSAGLVTLLAANLVSVMTCAAEIGGIALVWQLLQGWPYRALVVLAFVALVGVLWWFSFGAIERVFGLLGLLLLVYVATAAALKPDWGAVARGLVPGRPPASANAGTLRYAYDAVALLASIMMPYAITLRATGAIEGRCKPSDLALNRTSLLVGSVLGALVCAALVVVGAQALRPQGIDARLPGAAVLAAADAFGRAGLLAALLGLLFAFAGAATETTLSGAYNTAQFFGWSWGKFRRPREAGRFHLAWFVLLALAALVILTGIDPVRLVEYAILCAVVTLPFTCFPILVVAADRRLMGGHANGRLANTLGWGFLALGTLAALAAIPLLILTQGGRP
jgi:Mn2+/Fe2+ NRAMP family transporter